MQECSTTFPPTSSREFIHSILCRRTEGCTFYQRPCVDWTCPRCGGMAFLDKCIHVTDEHELGRHEVNLHSFKYVTYDIGRGNERKKIQLVTSQVSNKFLNSIFSYWYLLLLHICNNLLICTSLLLIYQVLVCNFMEEFFEKTQQYVKHVHVARWQDEQFKACRDIFPIGTILSVVDFV